MNTRSGRLVLCLLAGLAVTSPAASADPPSSSDRADIARIEAYLNGLQSMQSRFTQITSKNQVSKGVIYIERPGRLRLDYQDPPNIQVFVNGKWLVHVDTELEAVSHIPVSQTPARFLVGETLDLDKDVNVRRVIREPGTISIELTSRDSPDEGLFIMKFLIRPFRLLQWTVVDAQATWTAVILSMPEFNVPIPRSVFVFDAEKYGPRQQAP